MTADIWLPDYFLTTPLFAPLSEAAALLSHEHQHSWPGLDDYQRLFSHFNGELHSKGGVRLRFVCQDSATKDSTTGYEPRIYLKGEIQTRLNNWHDYFQVLVWCRFPQTKLAINALHYREARQRQQMTPVQFNRNPVENALTLFDECGAIIIADDIELLELIRDFRWKDLFWHQRQRLDRHLSCLVFGHALYEKALKPYIGMTAQALLLRVPSSFLGQPLDHQLNQLDQGLALLFNAIDNDQGIGTEKLTPFPLLGMPGWTDDNDDPAFYDNDSYFRRGRGKPVAPIFDLTKGPGHQYTVTVWD